MNIIEALNNSNSVEEATKFLQESKLKKPELVKLAKEAGIYIMAKWDKQRIIDQIVAGTTGSRIKIQILTGR